MVTLAILLFFISAGSFGAIPFTLIGSILSGIGGFLAIIRGGEEENKKEQKPAKSLEIAKERYAKGEISEEEFKKKKEVLKK